MGIFAAICVLIIYLFEKYMPIETQKPTLLFEPDETLKTLSRAELIKLEERDPKLPMFDYDELGKHTGIKGAKAYVCCKGKIFDCSSNEVYRADGGYNCFAGKEATLSLGKMEFDLVGKLGWRLMLNHEELVVVAEWINYFKQRYPLIGYLKEEYEIFEKEYEDGIKSGKLKVAEEVLQQDSKEKNQ